MSRKDYQENGSWEDRQNYKSYRRDKMAREEDIDYFKCISCNEYKDSYDESTSINLCLDCFHPEVKDNDKEE